MTPDLTLEPPEWMRHDAVARLMSLLNPEGQIQTLFVGGCVRNWMLKKPVQDIDLATKYTPDKVSDILTGDGVKVIPTGVEYGTVTAVIDGMSFEITTLRQDVETDGRHAQVDFTNDWHADARRRDFTMNTLLADMKGNIYDPLGVGLADAKVGRVIFVGQADARIQEDYLRILRYFRFYAYYGRAPLENEALKACERAADKVKTLSGERITQEFLKILSAPSASDVLEIMFHYGVLKDLAYPDYSPEILKKLSELQYHHKAVRVESRLFILGGNKARLYDDGLRLSHAQKKFIIKLEMLQDDSFYQDDIALKKAIYHHGRDVLLQGYLLNVAMGGGHGRREEDKALLEILTNWQPPICPIKGEDLIAEGYVTGPDLGQELKRRQEEWLETVITS